LSGSVPGLSLCMLATSQVGAFRGDSCHARESAAVISVTLVNPHDLRWRRPYRKQAGVTAPTGIWAEK
jgi:hypothetical protein